jgi:hypothetical protein
MCIEAIDWRSRFSFGKYVGEEILTVWINDKNYIQWCFDNNLHLKWPELQFIISQMKDHEKKQFGIK